MSKARRSTARAIERAYVTIDELRAGGTLTLSMGPEPSGWANAQRPPSYPVKQFT